jgi:hypothetical protein
MAHKTSSPHAAKPDSSSADSGEQLIRDRAYQLYLERGCTDGHDLDDWLMAEGEILGKRPSESATTYEAAASAATA